MADQARDPVMHQVFVTSDGRYIVTEPLYVLDVREWKQYALFESLQIPNYTKIEAISRDGKRLFISRRDCAIDCKRFACRILRAHLAVGEQPSILRNADQSMNRGGSDSSAYSDELRVRREWHVPTLEGDQVSARPK